MRAITSFGGLFKLGFEGEWLDAENYYTARFFNLYHFPSAVFRGAGIAERGDGG